MSISIQKRWEIIFLSKHRRGPKLSNSEIAKEVNYSITNVQRWLKRYEETGDVLDIPKSGRKKCTTQEIDEEIIQLSKEHSEESSAQLSQRLKRKNIDISDRTVRNRLNVSGIYKLKPSFKPLLTFEHRRKRYNWALQHHDTDWNKVLFSDEPTFQQFSNPRFV